MPSCPACGELLGVDGLCTVCLLGVGLGADPLPETIGRYRILRLLGEGGMGAVYEAEQDQPRRTVALKVVKGSLVTPELVRRFARESEALARLHHPGIAQVYEAGAVAGEFGAQPYFAMELVGGAPLTEFARSRQLSVTDRLQLIARICDAVHHAHQRGIIHRDLKPANILVDESGNPKILDFGVARITDSDAHATRQTDLGELVGTLAYMSPEQVLADPLEIDTRSDVYSLGVIFYELLAGRPPYDVGHRLFEAVQTIRDAEPARLGAVSREYRGDIETIAAKALEKERARRYTSAADLAADIRRYLDQQPIAARPHTAAYQLGKFARRRRALVAGAASVFVALLAGIVTTGLQLNRALRAERSAVESRQAATLEMDRALAAESQAREASRIATASQQQAIEDRDRALREQHRADDEAATAKAVSDFLQYDLLEQASTAAQATPDTNPDPNLTVQEALKRAAARIDGKFENQPQLEASIRRTMAQSYRALGLYRPAEIQAQQSLDLFRRRAAGDTKAIAQAMNVLAEVYLAQGKYADAETFLRQTMELELRATGPDAAETLLTMTWLARDYNLLARYREAEQFARTALEGQTRLLGGKAMDTIATRSYLADALQGQGQLAEAEQLRTQVFEGSRQALGDQHPFTLYAKRTLAVFYAELGKFGQATDMLTNVIKEYRRAQGPTHPATLVAIDLLVGVLLNQGRHSEALSIRTRTLETVRAAGGENSPATFTAMADLAIVRENMGDFDLAEPLWSKVWEGRQRISAGRDPYTMDVAARLAFARLKLKKYVETEPLLREAVAAQTRTNPDSWPRYNDELMLGACLAGQSRYEEAEPLLVEGLDGLRVREASIPKAGRFYLKAGESWIVKFYQDWGMPDKAAAWAERVHRAGFHLARN